jgi:hypothetical protein
MNVGVAIRTIFPDVGKNQIGVALPASKTPVTSAKRVTGFTVIECKNCADWSPGRWNVAIFTRNLKRAVRVRRRRPLLGGSAYGMPRKK